LFVGRENVSNSDGLCDVAYTLRTEVGLTGGSGSYQSHPVARSVIRQSPINYHVIYSVP